MTKKAITAPVYDVDNNQQQDRQPTLSYTDFQILLDKVGKDGQDYLIDDLIAELQAEAAGTAGIFTIGSDGVSFAGDNLGDNLAQAKAEIDGLVAGMLPPGTADYFLKTNAGATDVEWSNIPNANATNLDILRLAELDTGAADAYVVTTVGTFNRVDGNILPFIPANANTGASTINEDGNGIADIRKWVEGVSTALEEGDLPKFQKAELVWNSSEADFFYAPKGGAEKFGVLNIASGVDQAHTGVLVQSVNGSGVIKSVTNVSGADFYIEIDGTRYPSADFFFSPGDVPLLLNVEFNTNVKLYQNTAITPIGIFASIQLDDGTVVPMASTLNLSCILRQTVTGKKGKIGSITCNSKGVSVVIDGVDILGNKSTAGAETKNIYLDVEFTDGFEVYTSSGVHQITWQEY